MRHQLSRRTCIDFVSSRNRLSSSGSNASPSALLRSSATPNTRLVRVAERDGQDVAGAEARLLVHRAVEQGLRIGVGRAQELPRLEDTADDPSVLRNPGGVLLATEDLGPKLPSVLVEQPKAGLFGAQKLADLQREGLEGLLEHALEAPIVAQIDHAQKLLGLRGDLREHVLEAFLIHLPNPAGELAPLILLDQQPHHLGECCR